MKPIAAKDGYKFAISEFGLEQGHVRRRFEETSMLKKQYERSVPQSCIEKGYVEEVEDVTG